MNITPIGKRVVLKDCPNPVQSKGGILIPETAKNPSMEKIVVALGTAESFDVKVGDHVLVGQYQGIPLKFLDEELLLINEDAILCVMEEIPDEPAVEPTTPQPKTTANDEPTGKLQESTPGSV